MSNDNCLFILERINNDQKVLLDRPGYTYTCGKTKENDIVCHGIRVSNHHCTFFHNKHELYVTDLKSTHGTFINGVLQQPMQTNKLHSNDIIGIGCPITSYSAIDKNMHVYILHTYPSVCRTSGDSVSAPAGTRSTNNKKTANNKGSADSAHKRKQKYLDSCLEMLSEIARLQDQSCVSGENYFPKQLKIIQGKDRERSDERERSNAKKRVDVNVPTCSQNWPDEAASFPGYEESEKLSKPRLSDKKKTEREEKLHAQEQKNLQALRNRADCLSADEQLFSTFSMEEFRTLENSIKEELKKITQGNPASLGNDQKEKHIFPKQVKTTTKSKTIAGTRKKIATEEPRASSSRSAAADSTFSNAEAIDRIKSGEISEEMAIDLCHELYNRLLRLKISNK